MSSSYIKKQIKLYKSLKPCYCNALQEAVHFTSEGLHHLLYKNRRPRNHNEQHYRVSLIQHLIPVIANATKAIKNIKIESPKEIITWSLEYRVRIGIRKCTIKAILKKEGAGKLTFLSVMEKNHRANKKT